jgi:hypothetical protein
VARRGPWLGWPLPAGAASGLGGGTGTGGPGRGTPRRGGPRLGRAAPRRSGLGSAGAWPSASPAGAWRGTGAGPDPAALRPGARARRGCDPPTRGGAGAAPLRARAHGPSGSGAGSPARGSPTAPARPPAAGARQPPARAGGPQEVHGQRPRWRAATAVRRCGPRQHGALRARLLGCPAACMWPSRPLRGRVTGEGTQPRQCAA